MKTNKELQDKARGVIRRARASLGQDLDGGGLTDLLLDNLPELRSVQEARELLKEIGE